MGDMWACGPALSNWFW